MYDSVKDSGKRESFGTGAVRDSAEGKGRYDLLPTYALHRLARHFQNGAVKYGDENWRNGIPLRRFIDSALRHLLAYLEGKRDEDHAIAAAWNILALVETEEMIKRGILPVTLNNLPDWTERNVEQIDEQQAAREPLVLDAKDEEFTLVLDPAADGTRKEFNVTLPPYDKPYAGLEGIYNHVDGFIAQGVRGVSVTGTDVYRLFDDRSERLSERDRPDPSLIRAFVRDGYWIKREPEQIGLVEYRQLTSFGLTRRWRLNGDVVQYRKDNQPWRDLSATKADFLVWANAGLIVPADLDACGTTDGVTPIPGEE